jgi:hypothetical protein
VNSQPKFRPKEIPNQSLYSEVAIAVLTDSSAALRLRPVTTSMFSEPAIQSFVFTYRASGFSGLQSNYSFTLIHLQKGKKKKLSTTFLPTAK